MVGEALHSSPQRERPGARLPAASGRVLLVEDDEPLRQVYATVLAGEGHSVHGVATGAAAVDLIARRSFDVVVADVNLPGVSGIDVLRVAGAIDFRLPVILMSGEPTTESALQAVEHHATRFLVKPFRLTDLVGAVNGAVQQRRLSERRATTLEMVSGPLAVGTDAELSRQFDQALAGLYLAFQPIVRYPQQELVAYEALVRSDGPALRRPAELLGAAERLGRVADVGRAVRAWAALVCAGTAQPPTLFVNLHPQDLLDDDLYDPQADLSRHAPSVVLELTERSALEEIEDVRGRVAALRRLGYRLAIDDLGAGYSGLATLAHVEPEVVKLDMALTREIHRGRVKQRLVELLATLSREHGIMVVAEGVETTGERDALVALGCHVQQGYLFGRPAAPFADPLW
jgi:EAL domain-containing protein (putative c-di-GMP-specific phosphodiesterase class I)